MWQHNRYFLLQLLILILTPAFAGAEMMAGTVLSVDREQGVFVLRTDSQQDLRVHTDISPLPRRMVKGKRIRIWGAYEPGSNRFTATDIRGPGKNLHHDQTGVRARITKSKYCRKPPTSNTLDDNNDHDQQGDRGSGNGRVKRDGGSNR